MPRKTKRERLIELLEKGEFDVEQLASFLDVPVRQVVSDLPHVAKSTKGRFEMIPPECAGCGFIFRGRDKIKRPSRCPECRDERIEGPWFHVEREGG